MADGAKIILSAEELQLMCNKDWILTKRIVIDKVSNLLGTMVPQLKAVVMGQSWLPAEVPATNPKLHKGENYLGLPYLLLDYPAFFSKDRVFALRTFFWWGNFFSVTLHLSGSYKQMVTGNLLQNITLLQQSGLSICINTSEWHHHSGADNYAAAASLNYQQLQNIITTQSFVKLAANFSLGQWSEIPALVPGMAKKMLMLLTV
jgi:hypothetical protein